MGGSSISTTTTVTVTPPPAPTASCTVNNASPVVGTNADFVVSFSGGTAPYTSSLTFDGVSLPSTGGTIGATFSPSTPDPYSSSGYTVHIPMTAGTHQLAGQVQDATTAVTSFNCHSSVDPTVITVTPVSPLLTSCRLTTIPSAGSPTAVWTARVTGGKLPYTWPDGTQLSTYQYSHTVSSVYTPSFSVHDGNSTAVTPTCPPASILPPSAPTLKGVAQLSGLYNGTPQPGTLNVQKNQKFMVLWNLDSATHCQLNANPSGNIISGSIPGTELTTSDNISDIKISADTVFTLDGCKDAGGSNISPSPTLTVHLNKGSNVIEQ